MTEQKQLYIVCAKCSGTLSARQAIEMRRAYLPCKRYMHLRCVQ